MEKHLTSGSLQAWPTPRALQYTQTQVGEAFESLERDLRTTILAEAEKNYQDFLAVYKREMNKATSTAFKLWEDLIKKWQDKLTQVDSSLSQLDVFKTIIREQAYEALRDENREFYNNLDAKFTTLEAGKQELHQVVADSITTYVSELQDSLTQSTQALQQSTQALQQSTQMLAVTQMHLDTAVQELQRLQSIGDNNRPSSNNIVLPTTLTNTISVDDCTAETGTTNHTCLPTTTTAETVTMSNTALAQLAQSKSAQQKSIEAWASAPRVPPVDTVPTTTTDTIHAANNNPTPTMHVPTSDAAPCVPPAITVTTSTTDAPHASSIDLTPTMHVPPTDAAPTTTHRGSGIPTPPPQVDHDIDRREESRDNFYRREDTHNHYSHEYTRRDHYSPRSSRFHNETPRSYHEHERDPYPRSYHERDRESYPPQYSDMARKDKQKLSLAAQKWITGGTEGDFMGSFVHGVKNLSPVTLDDLGVPEEAQMTIANTHLRLRNNTPYITGALKFTKWPTLDVMQPAPFVEFYSLLGSSLLIFHIALMPFNGIQLEYEEHGLCIPGLGYAAYQEQSQALWSIINTLLPTRADIKTHITSTRSTQDGYRLLWLVGSQVVKILSRLQSVPEPRWLDNDTVFSFSDTVELYKILRRMRGQGLDDKDIGIKFLVGVRGKHQALAQSMAHQLSKVDISRQPLPLEWTLSSMADTLNTTVTGSVLDEMRLPQLRQKKPYYRANYTSDDTIDYADTDDTSMFYSPSINATTNTRYSDPSQQRGQSRGQQRSQSKTDQQQRGDNGQRRRTPLFDGNCTACGRFGHKMTHCDHLAIFFHIQRAMKGMKPEAIKQAEQHWLEKNKKFVGDGAPTPSQVVANLVINRLDIEQIYADMDWEMYSDTSGFTLVDDSTDSCE